jgi:EAL and modified HD-GYP domain-containing signal transduction protein
MAVSQFMVGRQPIFGTELDVRGYELVFREPGATGTEGEAITAEVFGRAQLGTGLQSIVGDNLAFVKVSRSFLVGELEITLPPERTVLEILDIIAGDEEAAAGCRRLTEQGYTLAMDGHRCGEPDDPLVELVSMVKLDVPALSRLELAFDVERCAALGLKLIAEKIEAHDQMSYCQDLGFELFQGYLLSRPEVVEGQALTPARVTCLNVVNQLSDPDADANDIQRIVETDPALSYRFLRLAGEGAGGGMYRRISSVREGVVLLGQQRLRALVTLMLLSGTSGGATEQLRITMTRARMCELVATRLAPGVSDSAFTVGLVSALELLLAAPVAGIVSTLQLAGELVDAVLEKSGPLGDILYDVLAWEVGGEGLRLRNGLSLATLEQSYLEALAWATGVCGLLEESDVSTAV